MWETMFLLAVQGISGGVAGYITNKYAVNMLFKEYTPLKLGGVIKKKKENFIEEISKLVERDMINSETLKNQIATKNFNKYVEQISETFLKRSLNSTLAHTKVCEIADFSNSIIKNQEFIRENLNKILPELLDNIFTNINLEDILSENQILKIVESSYEVVVQEVELNQELDKFISSLYKENSTITLSDIFSEEVQRKITTNITEAISEIINEKIFGNEEDCKLLFDKILSSINIDSTLYKLQGLIGDYEFNNIINKNQEEEFALELFNKINEFINSENGKELIANLMNEIFLIGKEIDFTIYEILPKEMEESLTNFIETAIPKVMPYISEWISSNKSTFDEIIESSIDEAISNVDGNIKKLVMTKVRSAFMGDISSKNNIVRKIIDYMNNSCNDESYRKIANLIINYLKNKKIKDLVELAEEHNVFNSIKLTDFIIKQFNKHGDKLIASIVKSQFSKKIHTVIKFDLVKLFNNKIKATLYNKIFENKNNISERINNLVRDFIDSKGKEIFNKEFNKLIKDDAVSNFSNNFKSLIASFLKENSNTYKTTIQEFLFSKIKGINLLLPLENYKEQVSVLIVDNSIGLYNETVDKYKNYELKNLVNKFLDKDKLSKIIINKGYPALIDNLPKLLDGKIEKFVNKNLRKYNEDEICDMVQEFMGGQLKPLSVFGAFLGTIVGILYAIIVPNSVGMYGFSNSILNTILSCITMGFIGYITNVIALWMIFRPYKENKIVSKIPFLKKFALGYIPAHKNEFAIGMAKLIDEELLNKEEVSRSFNKQKNNTKSVLMSLVTNNNYQIVINFLNNKKQDLTKYFYNKITKCYKNSEKLSEKISQSIGNNTFKRFINKADILNVAPKIIDVFKNIENTLVNTATIRISSNYKLNDILPKSLSANIEEYVENEITELIKKQILNNKKSEDFMYKIINDYSMTYDEKIRKTCKEIFDEEVLNKVRNNMELVTETYIFKDFKIHVSELIKESLSTGLDENNTIGSMFNGNLKKIIDKNLYSLTTYITDKLVKYLQDNEYKLSFNVKESIQNELNFFEKIAYGAFGGDDIVDKVVSIILNKKLPIMIKYELDKITCSIEVALDNSIYPMKVSTLKIKANDINTGILFDNIFEQFSKSNGAKGHIRKSSILILDSILNTQLIKYLEICNLHDLNMVYNRFSNEINMVKQDIYNDINTNLTVCSKLLGEFLEEKILTPLLSYDNSKIFNEINSDDIRYSVKNILNIVLQSEQTKKYLNVFLEDFYDNKLAQMQIKQIVDIDTLSKDIEKISEVIFNKEDFNEINIKLTGKVIENAINNNLDFITDNMKYYLTDKTIESSLDSISDNIVPILKEIDLKDITNKQIDLMNPAEIERLFKSFAGEFFKKLYNYGAFGFVFGINVGLSIILWAIDLRYSKVSSKRDLDRLEDL